MGKTLNIVGGGNLGMTLGRLWHKTGFFTIQDVLNRSVESGRRSVQFIGAGRPAESDAGLRQADVWLIATPDGQIASCAERLARTGMFSASTIVFHCSGALPAAVLTPAAECGAKVASSHPIRSFADPAGTAEAFGGTFCGIEGDDEAMVFLEQAFEAIGARCVPINQEFKTVYHAAAVFASNYLVTLLDIAAEAYRKAGIPHETAMEMIEPLVRGTVDNVFQLGPEAALSGPIARGDIGTAVLQYRAVKAWDERYGALYKQFAKVTADLAARRRSQAA